MFLKHKYKHCRKEAADVHAKMRSIIVVHRVNNNYIYYIYVVNPPDSWPLMDPG